MRRAAVLSLVGSLAFGLAPGAGGAWSVTGDGTGSAKADTIGQPAAPQAARSGLTGVRVTWTAPSVGAGAVAGYVVRRYSALLGTAAVVGPACAGVVQALECVESNVAPGTWRYTVTAVSGSWSGPESPTSSSIVV